MAMPEIDKKKYPNIPPQFWSYLQYAARCQVQDRWLSATTSPDWEDTLRDVDQRFKRASKILHLPPPKIAKEFHLDPNNVTGNYLDSFFAELRAVFFLQNAGLSDITHLRRTAKPSADLVAQHGSIRYAVEVFYSSSDNYKWPNHKSRRPDLIRYLVDTARRKRIQVDESMKEHACQKGILPLVLDSYPARALLRRSDFAHVLDQVYRELAWGVNYLFGIITGMDSVQEGPDDVLFPALR